MGRPHSSVYDINQAGYVTGRSALASSSDAHAYIAAPGGRMIDLGVLPGGGRNSYGEAINNLNQVVGASEITAGSTEQHAFVYTDGTMWNLNKLVHAKDPLRGYVRLFAAFDINDNGWIVAGGVDERTPDVIRSYLLRPFVQ
jgi:probable HAF family extracellular repeat protein